MSHSQVLDPKSSMSLSGVLKLEHGRNNPVRRYRVTVSKYYTRDVRYHRQFPSMTFNFCRLRIDSELNLPGDHHAASRTCTGLTSGYAYSPTNYHLCIFLRPIISTSFPRHDFSDLRSGANPWQSLQHAAAQVSTQPLRQSERQRPPSLKNIPFHSSYI